MPRYARKRTEPPRQIRILQCDCHRRFDLTIGERSRMLARLRRDRARSGRWRSTRPGPRADAECFVDHDGFSVAGGCVDATRAGPESVCGCSAPRSSRRPTGHGARSTRRGVTPQEPCHERVGGRRVLANEVLWSRQAATGPVPRAGTERPRSLLCFSYLLSLISFLFSLYLFSPLPRGPEGPCRFASRRSSRLVCSPA